MVDRVVAPVERVVERGGQVVAKVESVNAQNWLIHIRVGRVVG